MGLNIFFTNGCDCDICMCVCMCKLRTKNVRLSQVKYVVFCRSLVFARQLKLRLAEKFNKKKNYYRLRALQ